jgi:iron complex outermembrane receptor protein
MPLDLLIRHRSGPPLLLASLLAGPAQAAFANAAPGGNFASLSLEELSDIQVTSVSKKVERLGNTAASVFVIGSDDIRRAGATTLPEALRLAPNLQVARVDARNYAVTARGFNSPFENKLLVLIDGRAVYSPLFSGVYWDAQDAVLEDIERIEVISGPGATLWGANAVNGVINIITRSAADSQGTLLTAGGDRDRDRKTGAARHGGKLGSGGHYRIYAKYAQADDSRRADGVSTGTGWRRHQAGFRIDSAAFGGSATLQGDAYDGSLRQAGTRDIRIGGANLLARVTRTLAGGSELRLQAYLDHTQRDQPNAFVEHLNTADLELQHTLNLSATQQLIWGGGQRVAYDRVDNGRAFGFLPGARDLSWTSLFAQDDISLTPTLRLTGGLKVERNTYTGREYLPSLSMAWQAAPEHLVWSSLSRAVRVPSRIDRDLYAPTNPPIVNGVPRYAIAGGPQFVSEVAKVVQLGYRGQPLPRLSYAMTLYYSQYERLRTLERNPAGAGLVFLNQASGASRGAELSGRWDVTDHWRLSAGLSAQRLEVHTEPGSTDVSGATGLANNDPSSWSMLRSSYDLSDTVELDLSLRHVGALQRPMVPDYTALDLRVGWKIHPDVELSVLAQNLLASDHAEFGGLPGRSVFERNVFARVSWRF